MVFQSYALFPHMNVLDNVCYGPMSMRMDKAKARELAHAKLAMLGLDGLEERLPSELSGGQQQRVAVARSLVLEPAVLLFDEPLSNLDAKLRRRVRQEIRELQQSLDLTVIYVTHDQEEALAVSDQVIVMDRGRIAQQGTPPSCTKRPRAAFLADFIGDANLVAGELARDGGRRVVSCRQRRRAGRRRRRRAGPATLAVRPHRLRLDARRGRACCLRNACAPRISAAASSTCWPRRGASCSYSTPTCASRSRAARAAGVSFGTDDAIVLPGTS